MLRLSTRCSIDKQDFPESLWPCCDLAIPGPVKSGFHLRWSDPSWELGIGSRDLDSH